MTFLAANSLEVINDSLYYLDIIMVVAAFGIGIFSIVNPKKAWSVFQSKKIKKTETPTEKTIKTTRNFGVVITILAIAFVFIAFL